MATVSYNFQFAAADSLHELLLENSNPTEDEVGIYVDSVDDPDDSDDSRSHSDDSGSDAYDTRSDAYDTHSDAYDTHSDADDTHSDADQGYGDHNDDHRRSTEHQLLLTYQGGTRHCWNFLASQRLDNKLRGRSATLPRLTHLAIGVGTDYYVQFADGKSEFVLEHYGELSKLLLSSRAPDVERLVLGAAGCYYVETVDGQMFWDGLPTNLAAFLKKHDIQALALNPRNEDDFAVVADDGGWLISGNDPLHKALTKTFAKAPPNTTIHTLQIVNSGGYLLVTKTVTAPPPPPQPPARAARGQAAPPTAQDQARELVAAPLTEKVIETASERIVGCIKALTTQAVGPGILVRMVPASPTQWLWYVGDFSKGAPLSQVGLLQLGDGTIYRGSVGANRALTGTASILFSDGTSYSGVAVQGMPHGFGVRLTVNGKYSIGYFADGGREGPGVTFYTDPNAWDGMVMMVASWSGDQVTSATGSKRYSDERVFTGNCSTDKGSTAMPSNAQRWITLSPEEKTVLSSLAAKSKEHVERQWPRSDGLVSVETFDTTNTKNRSVRAFVRGLRLLESLRSPSTWNPRRVSACVDPFQFTDSVSYVTGYHGTSAEAIATIAKDGFDTTLRSGQNQGPGEYFARRYQDAMSFAKQNCTELLVCVVLAGPFSGVADEFCFVCNNPPTCSGVAFTLPVARVRFHQPSVRSRLSVSAQGVRLQFLWRGNAEEWVPYSPVHNAKLNECMTRNFRGDRATRVRLPALRHDNTGGDDYVVDIKKQTQTNLRTSYVREVKWHRVPAMPLRVAVE